MDDNLVLFVVFVVVEFWIFFMENDVFIEFKIFEKRVVLIEFEECVIDLLYWLFDDKLFIEFNEILKG